MSVRINKILYKIKELFGSDHKVLIHPDSYDDKVTVIRILIPLTSDISMGSALQLKKRLLAYWKEEMPELLARWKVTIDYE